MHNDSILYEALHIFRSFDSEGRPHAIFDDDLEGIFSKSDFAKGAAEE